MNRLVPVLAVAAWLLVGCDGTEPTYYVDGARPSPGANEQPVVSQGEYVKGCVPWSEERPDLHICAPVPEGWSPPPPPGSYADYKAVCDEAAKAVEDQASSLADRYQLRSAPVVDVGTCGAGGMSNGRWLVKFGPANADDVRPYRSAELFGFDPSSTEPFLVTLSKHPWPVT